MSKFIKGRSSRIVAQVLVFVMLVWTVPPASGASKPRQEKPKPKPDIQALTIKQMKLLRGSGEYRNEELCGKRDWFTFVKNVNVNAMGNLFLSWTDLQVPAPGIPIAFVRSYNSNDNEDGGFGIGWNHSYNMWIDFCPTEEDPDELVKNNPSGSKTYLHRNADGYYRVPAYDKSEYTSTYQTVTNIEGDRVSLDIADKVITKDGTIITYEYVDGIPSQIEGRRYVTSIRTRHENSGGDPTNKLTFTYGSGKLTEVRYDDDRYLTITWDGDRIESVSSPDSRTVHYDYTDGFLTRVTTPGLRETTFTYYTSGQMEDEAGVLHTISNQGESVEDTSDDSLITYDYRYGLATTDYSETANLRVAQVTEVLDDNTSIRYRYQYGVSVIWSGMNRVGAVDSSGNWLPRKSENGDDLGFDVVDYSADPDGLPGHDLQWGLNRCDITMLPCGDPVTNWCFDYQRIAYGWGESYFYPVEYVVHPNEVLDELAYFTFYDSKGNVTKRSRTPSSWWQYVEEGYNEETIYVYSCCDKDGNIRVDGNGHPSPYRYDDYKYGNSFNQPWCVKDPEDHLSLSYYDEYGNVLVAYDAKAVARPDFLEGSFDNPYNPPSGFPCIKFTYNSRGQVEEMTDSRSGTAYVTRYGHDTAGNLVSVKRPNPDHTEDPNDPDYARTTTIHYDAAGRVDWTIDPNHQSAEEETTIEYNDDGQPKTVTAPDMTVSYTYFANGLTESVTQAEGGDSAEYTYYYYRNGTLKSVSDPAGTVEYTYDEFGNRASAEVEGVGTFNYWYTIRSLPSVCSVMVTDPRGYKTLYKRDMGSADCGGYSPCLQERTTTAENKTHPLVKTVYNTGSWLAPTDTIWETVNSRFTEDQYSTYEHTISKFRFTSEEPVCGTAWNISTYDKDRNRMEAYYYYNYRGAGAQECSDLRKTTYAYNDVHALTAVSEETTLNVGRHTVEPLEDYLDVTYTSDYEYDDAGNRTSKLVNEGEENEFSETYSYDAAMQMTDRGSIDYTYDANGNLTSDGTRTYTWDSMNRLRSIAAGGTTTSFTYRPDGMRATKSVDSVLTMKYLYDGQSLVAEKDSSGTLKVSYTNGLNEVISRTEYGESTDTIFFLYDANCNVNAIVDEAGELVKTFDYEEFGGPHPDGVGQTYDPNNQNAANNKLLFAGGVGHPTDDGGLIYMRARYYDPASGRFISEDPGYNGTNWYAYCGNNPINGVDPSGRAGISSDDVWNWVAGLGGWEMAEAYLIAVSVALGELGAYMCKIGAAMAATGTAWNADWLTARGGVVEGDGIFLRTASVFLTAAAVIAGALGDMEDSEAAGYVADFLTSASSVGGLFD